MEREVSKEPQTRPIHDGTLICFSIQLSPEPPEPGIDLPAAISFPSGLAEIPQANEPSWGRMLPLCVPRQVDEHALSSRTTRHSLKLSRFESQVPVPVGKTPSAALSRRESKQHHAHRLPPHRQPHARKCA